MRRVILIICLLFIAVFVAPAKAQELDFNTAYNDYVFAVDNYRQAENEYQLKRSEYLRFGTLTAKSEAEVATRAFLQSRDDVVTNYLTALRLRLAEVPGVDSSEKDSVFSAIDAEVGWHIDHKNRLNSAGDLEDLVADSNEAEERFEDLTVEASYKALHLISRAKVLSLTGPQSELVNRTQNLINRIRENGDKSTSVVERWLLDAQNELNRSVEKTENARNSMSGISDTRDANAKRALYNTSISSLIQSHQHLKDANRFLTEILVEVKTAD
jgi:hypothetical protein